MSETPKHTPGARRAARLIFDSQTRKQAALIIDRETAAPELLAACKDLAVAYANERKRTMGAAWILADEPLLTKAEAAIAKAEAAEPHQQRGGKIKGEYSQEAVAVKCAACGRLGSYRSNRSSARHCACQDGWKIYNDKAADRPKCAATSAAEFLCPKCRTPERRCLTCDYALGGTRTRNVGEEPCLSAKGVEKNACTKWAAIGEGEDLPAPDPEPAICTQCARSQIKGIICWDRDPDGTCPDFESSQKKEQRDELLDVLKEVYEWTRYKDTPWAVRAAAAIAKAKEENE